MNKLLVRTVQLLFDLGSYYNTGVCVGEMKYSRRRLYLEIFIFVVINGIVGARNSSLRKRRVNKEKSRVHDSFITQSKIRSSRQTSFEHDQK